MRKCPKRDTVISPIFSLIFINFGNLVLTWWLLSSTDTYRYIYSINLYCSRGRIDILELIYFLVWLHSLLFHLFSGISVSRRSRDLNNISEIFPGLHCIHLYSHYKRHNTFKLKYFLSYPLAPTIPYMGSACLARKINFLGQEKQNNCYICSLPIKI